MTPKRKHVLKASLNGAKLGGLIAGLGVLVWVMESWIWQLVMDGSTQVLYQIRALGLARTIVGSAGAVVAMAVCGAFVGAGLCGVAALFDQVAEAGQSVTGLGDTISTGTDGCTDK